MAIGLVSILEILFVAISILCVSTLFYKDGKYVNTFWKFAIVAAITLLGLYINYTSLPSNYMAQKLIEIVMMIITLLSLVLYGSEFKISRIILAIIALLSLVMFFI